MIYRHVEIGVENNNINSPPNRVNPTVPEAKLPGIYPTALEGTAFQNNWGVFSEPSQANAAGPARRAHGEGSG